MALYDVWIHNVIAFDDPTGNQTTVELLARVNLFQVIIALRTTLHYLSLHLIELLHLLLLITI